MNSLIRRIDLATNRTSTLRSATHPRGVAIDPSGTFALVAVRRGPRIPLVRTQTSASRTGGAHKKPHRFPAPHCAQPEAFLVG